MHGQYLHNYFYISMIFIFHRERLDCRAIIKDNVFECITALVNQMATLQIPLGDKGNLASWTFIRNMSITKNKEFSQVKKL